MKINWIISLVLLQSQLSYSQTWEEWFEQKETKKKYLAEQIAANKVYLEWLEKGYGIARDGLGYIQDAKKGEFQLHLNFFESLKKVNPRIQHATTVGSMIALQLRMINQNQQTLTEMREEGQLTSDELRYCQTVFQQLSDEILQHTNELLDVLGDNSLQLGDDERIKRIDALYADTQEQYAFSNSFGNEMGLLSAQRISEKVQIDLSRKLNRAQ